MFLMENVVIALLCMALIFIVFTFVNVYSFCKDVLTGLILTINVLYLFLIMPFKGVNQIHHNRNKIVHHMKKNPDFSMKDREEFKRLLNSKIKIFILLYKNSAFSYNELILTVARWYVDNPFQLRLRFKYTRELKEKYEDNYMDYLKQDLKEAVI